jgi:guanylate kinase
VISGPSAVGKSTLIRRLVSELGAGLAFCVSTTTRAPRAGEVDGVDYRFVSTAQFERAIEEGGFIEWVKGGNGTYYGTSSAELMRVGAEEGKAAILDLDVRGAGAVYALPAVEPCCIFVSPPSLQALETRLRNRGTESAAEMAFRMRRASAEIEAAATTRIFEHYLINDELEDTYAQLKKIVLAANVWLNPYAEEAEGGSPDGAGSTS